MHTIYDRAMVRALILLTLGLFLTILVAEFSPVRAADKSAPAPAAAVEDVRDPWRSCYVEAGASGAINTDSTGATRSAILNGGGGCTYHIGGLGVGVVGGAFLRGGVSVKSWDVGGASLAFDVPATVGARAGVLVSPSVLVYGMGGYTFARGNGQHYEGLMLGGGVEAIVTGNMSVAIEYQNDALSAGLKRDSVLGLVRFRF